MKENIERAEEIRREEYAAKLANIISTVDLENIKTKSMSTYNRENLRSYLKNPSTDSNAKNLRKLSAYLYTVSHVYRRLVQFKANQLDCKVWTAYPIVSFNDDDNDVEKILSEYDRVTKIVNVMHMEQQINKIALNAWLYGVAYAYVYGDPEKDGEFMLYNLDPDYCRISGVSFDGGVFGVAFDFSYFNENAYMLETMGKDFEKLYNEYKNNTTVRWKNLPLEKAFCIKIDPQNISYSIPPLSGQLESIISLADIQAAQEQVDEIANEKLLWGKLDTIDGSNIPDDYKTSLKLAMAFMEKVASAIPDSVGHAISPMDLKILDLGGDQTKENNVIAKSYQNLIEANGAIILNSNRIQNSKSFQLALKAECDSAMAPVTQVNAWINYYLKKVHNNEFIRVEFSDISPYFRDDAIDKMTKVAGLSVPVKFELASLMGANVQKATGMDYLERNMGISQTRWINPLVSSNTVSASDGPGAPVKEDGELSDEGQENRDKEAPQ